MKTFQREARTKARIKTCPFPELQGMFFEKADKSLQDMTLEEIQEYGIPEGRIYVLLWGPLEKFDCADMDKYGWQLCHAWGDIKGFDPRDKELLSSVDGWHDNNVLNPKNYYRRIDLNTKAKTPEKVINSACAMGFIYRKGKVER